ncbi:Oidioi.mRNA.OKI2018_I69.chr1.g2217.t1.cds [Oikopleura dioica]|uniref:Oidioi.mRNA.OKI2018_I69.chr1.g2217.t1.cds n=1 Tax=Oikopleura dioica TaxID=34765 RepID=A0ABN7SQZ5_OIKDI|nr:Oidioi.mRNA.OKI2018_I69.chr1.g2217.t1.cds [Oikopleura dioica]
MKGIFALLTVAQAALIFNDDHIDLAKVDYEDVGLLARFARQIETEGSGVDDQIEEEVNKIEPETSSTVEESASTSSTDTEEDVGDTEVLEDGVTEKPNDDPTADANTTTTTAAPDNSSTASSTTQKATTTKSPSSSGQMNTFTFLLPTILGALLLL